MGTRSFIVLKESEKYQGIYCHWDGYIDHNGRILHDHYHTTERVKELFALGDLSILNSNIGVKVDFDDGGKDAEGIRTQCLAYGRDRGQGDSAAKTYHTFNEVMKAADECGAEYVYVFDEKLNTENKWQYLDRGACFFGQSNGKKFSNLLSVAEAIEAEDKINNEKSA